MPIFQTEDKRYRVQDKDINKFAAKYPMATIVEEREGTKYRVKAKDYNSFLEKYPVPVQPGYTDNMHYVGRMNSEPTEMQQMQDAQRMQNEDAQRRANARVASGDYTWQPMGKGHRKGFLENPELNTPNVPWRDNFEEFAAGSGRRLEQVVNPDEDAWTQAKYRAWDNIGQNEALKERKKNAEEAVGEIRSRVSALSDKYDEVDRERDNAAVLFNPTTMGGVSTRQGALRPHSQDMAATLNIIYQTEKMIADFTAGRELGGWANLGRAAVTTVFDPHMWDFGLGDLTTAKRLEAALDKADKGDKLTDTEQLLIDAAVNQQVLQAYYGELNNWQEAGKAFGEMLPFMGQIAMNPLSAIGKYAGSTVAKKVFKHIAKRVGEKGISKILKKGAGIIARTMGAGARVAGDVLGGYGVAMTSNIANTAADAIRRQIGDINFDFDDNGVARYDGRTNVKDVGEAWKDAINNNAFEFVSESMGDYFKPILKGLGRLGGKAVEKIGMGDINRWVDDFVKNSGVRAVDEFFKRTQFQDFLSEYAEEITNGMLNATFVGDMTMDEVFSKENLIDTAIGLSVMSGINTAVGTGGYIAAKRAQKKDLNDAAVAGQAALRSAWKDFAGAVETAKDMSELRANLRNVMQMYNARTLSRDEQIAVFNYAKAWNSYKALQKVSAKAVQDGVADAEEVKLRDLYERGRGAVDKKAVRDEFETARTNLATQISVPEDYAVLMFADYGEALRRAELAEDNGDKQTGGAIREFVFAKAMHDGMTEFLRDDLRDKESRVSNEIDTITNKKDGNVYEVALRNGLNGYIIDGAIVLDEQGYVDEEHSDELLHVYVDGEVKQITPVDVANVINFSSAEDLKEERLSGAIEAYEDKYNRMTARVDAVNSAAPSSVATENTRTAAARAMNVNIDGLQEAIPNRETGEREVAMRENAGDVDGADAIRRYIAETFNNGESISSGESVSPVDIPEFFRLNGRNYSVASKNADGSVDVIVDGKRETLPAGTDYSTYMPTDKKGEVQYEQMPVERTHEYFVRKVTNDKARALMIEKNRKKAEAERKKFDKDPDVGTDPDKWEETNRKWEEGKKAAQAKVDYWNEVAKRDAENVAQPTTETTEEVGPFGRIYRQFKGKAKEAIQFLLGKKEGEAVGALNHPEIGDIDLVWGEEGTSNSDGYGLAKLAKYHPEVLENLQEIINDMHVTKRSANRVQLESDTHQAAVRLTWDNKSKNWLLTAFEKKNSVSDNTTDTGETSNGGKQNDTATLQNTVSTSKSTTQSANKQENGKENAGNSTAEQIKAELKKLRKKIAINGNKLKKMLHLPKYEQLTADYKYFNEYLDSMDDYRALEKLGIIKRAWNAEAYDALWAERDQLKQQIKAAEERLKNAESAADDVQGGGQNGVAQEKVQSVNSSGIPNGSTLSQTSDQVSNQVAEGDAPGQSGIDPRNMSYDERAKRGDMLRNAPAVDVNEGVITSTKELSARKAAEKWWDENVTEPAFYETEVGEVEISRNSVESSLAHRYGQAKLDALTSLIEGFENAVYLGSMPDGTRHGSVMNHYFAYPINYKGERCYVFCRAMHDANKNRLYVHEVFIADRIKKGDTLQTAASQLHGGIALYKDILANVLNIEPTSASEDINSVSNSQENTQKSGEIAENGGEIQEPRFVEENLDNGDKRITNYNSRGEVATVAIERDGKVVSVDSYDEGVLFEHTEYDTNGKAASVTRYDKQGNVVGTQVYEDGKAKTPMQKLADRILDRTEEKRRIPLRERARELEAQVGVKANIIESLDEVKNREARKRIAAGEPVAGWYSGGQVYLYMPNINDRREIELTYVHEVVAHYGVKKLLGERFNEFLDGVWNMMSEADRARMLAYVGAKETPTLQDMRAAADEYVAELAEKMDFGELEQSTWEKIVDWFKELLESAGFENLTKEDIESMLKASYANLRGTEQGAESKENGFRARMTFHGSGAQFDRFDHSFMGTGEGAQAFGWGTYVTEVEGIGRTYAESTSGNIFKSGFGDFYLKKIREGLAEGKSFEEIKQNLLEFHAHLYEQVDGNTEMYGDFISDYEKLQSLKEEDLPKRNLYTVEIPDDNGSNYLHWEEVVPESIKGRILDAYTNFIKDDADLIRESLKNDEYAKRISDEELVRDYADIELGIGENTKGKGAYKSLTRLLGSQELASKFLLNEVGLVGISYPAEATTGGRADGARNYVIFNENDAQIKDRTMFRKKDSERRQEKRRINDAIDTAAGFITVGGKKQATKNRLKKEAERKQLAKEMYSSVLKGDFNDVTLSQIDKFIEDATPANPFGRRISQRLPQRMERALRQGARTNAVDALFSRICESTVPANERFSEAGRREIEERKKELLKGWAIATGNWHTDLKEFTDDTETIGEGKDSKVYMSKDGNSVIKASKGKPFGKKFRPDIDNIPLFNDVFKNSRYEILGYGEIDGQFVRILKQDFIDFAESTPLTPEERKEYMGKLGFKPLNKDYTAFSNGEVVVADLQKSNIVKDAAGNISVIDADAKLHTKDVGGDYTYPPVEEDLPEDSGTRFRKVGNTENNSIFASTYKTEDGKDINYTSERAEGYGVQDDGIGNSNSGSRRSILQRQTDTGVPGADSGLDAEKGEFCVVERVFTENGAFNFTSGEKIESADDVAYIFSALEDAAKEHSFVVYVKDGMPTVVELGMGSFNATMVDIPTASLAYSRINPDHVYFVHNHPSGNLICSSQDVAMLRVFEDMSDVPVTGVIINLKTGKYGTFDTERHSVIGEKRVPEKEERLAVHTLDKQIFAPDYDPMAQPLVRGSQDVAQFLNSQRMGDRPKVSFLILSRANRIIGNIHTPFTNITTDVEAVARYINERVIQFGGENAILYGDFAITSVEGMDFRLLQKAMDRFGKTKLLDVVRVEGNFTRSANDMGLLYEPEAEYKDGQTMFRFIGERGAANLDNAEEATTRLDNLAVAREMETAGKEAKAIKLATGWERGADGNWRYETKDFELNRDAVLFDLNSYKERPFAEFDEFIDIDATVKLDELVNDEALFKAYPELKGYYVTFEKMGKGVLGSHNATDKIIKINRSEVGIGDVEGGNITSTLVHEVQHAIQHIEGFAQGGNSQQFQDNRMDVLKDIRFVTDDNLYGWSAITDSERLRGALDRKIPYTDITVKDAYAGKLENVAKKYGYNDIDALVESFDKMSAYNQYERLAGEVESRNVQERMNMTPEERRNSLAEETADVAKKDQIFIYDALESAMNVNDLFAKMNENAEPLVPRLLTEEVWENEIRGKRFKTPIGDVKLGENQYKKNKGKGREREFGMIIPTLERPDFIFEEVAHEEGAERQTKYVFAKAFYDNEGNKHVYYADVSVLKDGMEAVTSSHHLRDKQVLKKIRKEQMLWNRFASDSMSSAQGGSTDQSNALSADKGSDNSSNTQEGEFLFRETGMSSSRINREAERVDAEITDAVNSLATKMNADVEIVTDVNTIENTRKRASKGWYENGKVYVVLPNATSVDDAIETVLHEVVGHKGLRALFGNRFNDMLDDVLLNASKKVRMAIIERAMPLMAQGRGDALRVATEEYMAEQAERGFDDYSLWERIKGWFNEVLHSMGLMTEISDEEIRYMLWRSNQLMSKGGTFVGEIENIAKEAELDAGEYRLRENNVLEIRDDYERLIAGSAYQAREALQDSMRSLYKVQELIEKVSGKKIKDGMNGYYLENALSSTNKAEADLFTVRYYNKILDAIAALRSEGLQYDEIFDYMMVKHGVERNREMAVREALTDNKGLNKDAYKDWTEKKQEIWGRKLRWEEEQKALDDLAKIYGVDTGKDYSGLSNILGLGFKDKAYKLVKSVENGKRNINRLWEAINNATGYILEKQYLTNMMSFNTKVAIEGMYKYYVPLRGFNEKTAEDVYAYMTNSVSPIASNKIAKGRKSKADNPIAWIASMAESAIVTGNRNRMKNAFFNLVMMNPNDLVTINQKVYLKLDENTGEWLVMKPDISEDDKPEEVEMIVKDFEKRMEELVKTHPDLYKSLKNEVDIPYRVTEPKDMNEHQIYVRRNGKLFAMTVNGNPRLAQAINGLTNPDAEAKSLIDKAMHVGKRVNRWLSANYTTRNPDFVVSNFLRDALYTNTITWVKESPEYAKKFNANYAFSIVKIVSLIRKFDRDKLNLNDPVEKMFYDFMMNGGETGYTNVKNVEKLKKEMMRKLQSNGVKDAWNGVGFFFDEINRSIENAARFAAFITSREMGRSLERSIWDAKEISVNFNKKGAGGKLIGAKGQTWLGNIAGAVAGTGYECFVFWNAAIQGSTNVLRAGKHNKGKAAALVGLLALAGFAAAALNGDDDDEDERSYYNLPSYVRRSNIVFRVGSMDDWFTIPLPVEYRAIYGTAEYVTNCLMGKEKFDALEFASNISQILPLDVLEGGGGLNVLVPSWAKPIVEVYNNIGWSGTPIAKETPFNELDPEYKRVYGNVSAVSVELSKMLHILGGGDTQTRARNDLFEWNPAKMEYVINGYLGGLSSFAGKLWKFGEVVAGVKDYNHSYMPLLNRILKSSNAKVAEKRISNEYYKNLEDVNRYDNSIGGWSDDAGNANLSAEERENARREMGKLYSNSEFFELKAISDVVRHLNKAYKISGDDSIKKRRLDLMKEFNMLHDRLW